MGSNLNPAGGVLRYSQAHYQKKITALEGLAKQLEQHLNVLEGLRSRVGEFWEDESAQGYLKSLTVEIIAVRNAQNQVNSLKSTYEENMADLDKTKSIVDIDMKDVAKIIGGLGIGE